MFKIYGDTTSRKCLCSHNSKVHTMLDIRSRYLAEELFILGDLYCVHRFDSDIYWIELTVLIWM